MTYPMAHTPITYVSVETVCVSSSGSNRRGDVALHRLIICVWVSRKRIGKSNRCKLIGKHRGIVGSSHTIGYQLV
jgi:hypothetical protein